MNPLEEHEIQCPHCGEFITVLIDCLSPEGIEDCFVCCRPMLIRAQLNPNGDRDRPELTVDVQPTE